MRVQSTKGFYLATEEVIDPSHLLTPKITTKQSKACVGGK